MCIIPDYLPLSSLDAVNLLKVPDCRQLANVEFTMQGFLPWSRGLRTVFSFRQPIPSNTGLLPSSLRDQGNVLSLVCPSSRQEPHRGFAFLNKLSPARGGSAMLMWEIPLTTAVSDFWLLASSFY